VIWLKKTQLIKGRMKVTTSEKKKVYRKPQVQAVKLAVRDVVLGECWGSTQAGATLGACQITPGCAF
jgi:hypothetical protein